MAGGIRPVAGEFDAKTLSPGTSRDTTHGVATHQPTVIVDKPHPAATPGSVVAGHPAATETPHAPVVPSSTAPSAINQHGSPVSTPASGDLVHEHPAGSGQRPHMESPQVGLTPPSRLRNLGDHAAGMAIPLVLQYLGGKVFGDPHAERYASAAGQGMVALNSEAQTRIEALAPLILTMQVLTPSASIFANVIYDRKSHITRFITMSEFDSSMEEQETYEGTSIVDVFASRAPKDTPDGAFQDCEEAGGWDAFDLECQSHIVRSFRIDPLPFETLIEFARANGLPLDSLKSYARGMLAWGKAPATPSGSLTLWGSRPSQQYWQNMLDSLDHP